MTPWLGAGLRPWVNRSLLEGQHPNFFGSFYYESNRTMISPTQFRFFLDSGAYSAWTRGTQIDLDEYCAFIKANIEHIEVYANLDVIAGSPGKAATVAERNEGARQSWRNFIYMQSEGLDPIPVFHVGEDWSWLDKMIDHGCDYVGLGGLVGVPASRRRSWLDAVFMRITDEAGVPKIKTHGFGMTSIPLIFRYPWHSVDSTTWINITASGSIYLPAVVDCQFVFDQIPSTVSVSTRNPNHTKGGKGANTMSSAMRAILNRWLEECGKTYEEVAADYYHRSVCNVIYFKRVSEVKASRPFARARLTRTALWG